MPFVYIVRCNFAAPDKERAWNDWYSGPKIGQMLAKPYFLTCQRFRLSLGSGRNYLALWTIASPEAFKTKEYTSDWGFFEWRPYIVDWSRDLFDAGGRQGTALATRAEGALHVMSFDGMSGEAADAARANLSASHPNMMWMRSVGLDRHTPLIALQPRSDITSADLSGRNPAAAIQEAIYRPISDFHSADANVIA